MVSQFQTYLYSLISQSNNTSNSYLRQMACECLKEFELESPGVLQPYLGINRSYKVPNDFPSLHDLCQDEKTYVTQSYTTLFMLVLSHSVDAEMAGSRRMRGTISSSVSTITSSTPSGTSYGVHNDEMPFNDNISNGLIRLNTNNVQSFAAKADDISPGVILFPSETNNCMVTPLDGLLVKIEEFGGMISQKSQKIIVRSLSMALENCSLLNRWGLATIVANFIPFASIVHLSPDVFRHHFLGFIFYECPLLVHCALRLHHCVSGVFARDDEVAFVRRLNGLINNLSIAPQIRILAIRWLISFPADIYTSSAECGVTEQVLRARFLMLHRNVRCILPTVFDPLDVQDAKLHCLLQSYHSDPTHLASPKRFLVGEC
jgi:hypothetical protein